MLRSIAGALDPTDLEPIHRAQQSTCRVSRLLAALVTLLEREQIGIGAELALVAHEATANVTDDLERWLEETQPGIEASQDQNKTKSDIAIPA